MNDFSPPELMELVLENAYQGVIVIDEKGLVRYFNRAMEDISGLKREEIIGKHVKSYSRMTRLHKVLASGNAELGIKCQQWDNVILNRIPIRREGRIIGVVGLFLFKEKELYDLVDNLKRIQKKVKKYEQQIRDIFAADYELDDIVGESETLRDCKELVRRVANCGSTVLITGESGTGKEMFAHAIHNLSDRKRKAFVKVNCASIPSELIEAELFGYEPGAFTGAGRKTKMGKFQLADGGTLFLDEVGDMPLDMQAKVLRVLQSKEVERLGGNRSYKMDFRVIAATNKNLLLAIEERKFRVDLYYRLNVMPLYISPLRERPEDLEPLVSFFLHRECRRLGVPTKEFSPQSLRLLQAHAWPGNVRELMNAVTYAVSNSNGGSVNPQHLPPQMLRSVSTPRPEVNGTASLNQLANQSERVAIVSALAQTGGNKSKAAKLLKIHRSTLYKKMDSLGL
ncbi:MAG: sigma 54-interacting transcriptional regulator [Proteobacteria bacterium]|nr:sigma 54-interacting transcriptional regulator [Pseudomonadota bacterium]MBU4384742.1 sigma 54-interacting transcriptional regulator [Pseudomonadota bacterium]MBU4605293.1 sigma 54-interacting transcriptional regulator [Pseudomonadota bacterium]MCG2764052.1 sigma 54-interacting transcriptional regulator [Desulfarculaceae bacterium]